ncbi:M48 family metalloprotease [Lacibacter sediminis]|uniref:M48 family metalloprotease n=1 Tax=Lacibacter sediminis TaxID=2760713 RepID=A0A7G5XF00_9BACT|nr:M48 family metalloprotease [Lacibacter sediminis]QNA44053.1 M48 family metalloprotease [Lacibacter sediminis]
MSKVTPSLRKDYEEIYKTHFGQIEKTINSKSPLTAKEPHQYLQQVLGKIIKANPVLKADELRIFFTRDWWPNAYSMGDGSIAINAGLVIHMHNEAELAFVLCHELAHYHKSHTLQSVDNYVTVTNSSEFQKKLKELSKKEYSVNAELEKLSLNLIFNSRHHSRSKETEADLQAFSFFKNTGYDANGIVSLLQLLDTVDKATVFTKLNVQTMLNFESYPFKKKWIQEESAIFSKINTQTTEEKAKEIDSFKTHPDCTVRIAALKDSVASQSAGNSFLVDENYFQKLKEELMLEMIEHTYQSGNVSRNIYYNLLLLQQQKYTNLAAYLIARDLNKLYEQQKNHKAGLLLDTENKFYSDDYNQLLRLLNRIRLDEMAQLTRSFCNRYLSPLKEYQPVAEQLNIAEKNNNQH